MNKFDQERNTKILEILVGLKFLYIILATLNIISYYNIVLDFNSILLLIASTCCIASFMIFCSKMMYGNYSKSFLNMPSVYNIVEAIIILGLFIALMEKTGGANSSFKYIGMIIILISSMQYNKKISFSIAIAVSIIILSFAFLENNAFEIIKDFMSRGETIAEMAKIAEVARLAHSFDGDIILVSSLLITSFILSHYIEIEKEHNLKLTDLAIKDGLTGLYNHRSFQDVLDEYIKKSNKDKKSVSLLFMDIDNFKHFNDVNGHQKGDLLLTKLGQILKETVGDLGVVTRYGGEEFAIILYDREEEFAIKLGERIRQNIQNTYFSGQEHQPNKNITVSIGVSSYPKVAQSKKELLELADNALYRAKSFDKNRVEKYYNILDEIDSSINKESLNYIASILNRINHKDKYTYGHSERVVIYAKKFANYLNLAENEKKELLLAAYLHDIGKLEISKELLNKRERLSKSEFNILKQHPTLGAEIISTIDEFNDVAPIIKHHHEKFDGSGYPLNLNGNDIPYLARVLTIIDSFDAMTSKRPYNVRKDYNEAIEELRLCSGKHFDPDLVFKFIKMVQNDMLKKEIPSNIENNVFLKINNNIGA